MSNENSDSIQLHNVKLDHTIVYNSLFTHNQHIPRKRRRTRDREWMLGSFRYSSFNMWQLYICAKWIIEIFKWTFWICLSALIGENKSIENKNKIKLTEWTTKQNAKSQMIWWFIVITMMLTLLLKGMEQKHMNEWMNGFPMFTLV